MNKQEAQLLCKQGKKITHQYFTSQEYIWWDNENNRFVFEDNVLVPADWWNKDYLDTDWSEFKQ